MQTIAVLHLAALVEHAWGSEYGIFVDISEEDLLQAAGLTCSFTAYSAVYSHPTTSDDIHKPAVSAEIVLVGVKPHIASKYVVVGLGPHDKVLAPTSSIRQARYAGGGAFWYHVSGHAFGFAPTRSINLAAADTVTNDCERRMSWHLDNYLGGWSAGCMRGTVDTQWLKIVKYCNRTAIGTFLSDLYKSPDLTVVHMQPWFPSPGAQARNVIRFGAVLTLDCCSTHSSIGRNMERAYDLFVEWVNAERGGVLVAGVWHTLHLSLIDDRSEADLARGGTEYLVRAENISLLFGPYGSVLADQAAQVVNAEGAVMITPQASAEQIFRHRPRVFGISLLEDQTFVPIVTELAQQGARSIGVIRETDYPPAACDAIPALARQWGINVTWVHEFDQDSQNMSAIVVDVLDRFRSQPPDVVIVCANEEVSRSFYWHVQREDMYAFALVFIECVTPAWLETFGSAGQFVVGMAPWVPGLQTGHGVTGFTPQEFASQYERRFNSIASDEAASTWAAGMAMLAAVEAADSTDPAKVEQALRNLDIETAYGRITFNSDGQNTRSWTAVQFLPGSEEAHIIAPVDVSTATLAYPAPSWHTRQCFDWSSKCTTGLTTAGECLACADSHYAFWNITLGACLCRAHQCGSSKGYIINSTGTCQACPSGKFIIESATCGNCGVGSYASEAAQTACALCSAGKFANTTGRTSCEPCAPGKASSSEGSTTCVACSVGRSISQSAATQCSFCKAGTFAAGRGHADCEECAPGKSNAVPGGSSCEECDAGTYQVQRGMSACSICPEGATCDGHGTIWPENLENYWTFEHQATNSWRQAWLRCPVADRCKSNQRCARGHTGILCAVCLPEYSRLAGEMFCEDCSTSLASRVFSRTIFFIGLIFLTYSLAYAATVSASEPKIVTDVLIKLLLNYFTTISVTAGVFQLLYLDKILSNTSRSSSGGNWWYNLIKVLLKFSPLHMMAQLMDLHCLFPPSLSDNDKEWVEALAMSRHNQTFVPGDLAHAQQKLQDFHWQAAIRQFIFWFCTPVVFTLSCALAGFFRLLFNLLHPSGRQCVVRNLEFLDAVESKGFDAAREGLTEDEVEYFLRAPSRRLFGIYPNFKYARIMQNGGKALFKEMFKEFCADSSPLIVVGFFLLYPGLLQNLLQPLNCQEPLDSQKDVIGHYPVMAASLDLRCYQADDTLFWLSILGLVVYTVIAPLLAGLCLYLKRKSTTGDFRNCWWFFTSGYETDMAFWECIALFRQSVTVMLASISMDSGLRVFALLAEACIFSLLHVLHRPFDNRYDELLDRVECRHLLVWLVFTLALLWCYLDAHQRSDSDDEGQVVYIAGVSMCILHIWFICMICRQIINHASARYAEYLIKVKSSGALLSKAIRPRPSSKSIIAVPSKSSGLFSRATASVTSHSQRLKLEKDCFGGFADWRWEHYTSRKAHIFCDPHHMWFLLLGSGSKHMAEEPITLPRLSSNYQPEDVKKVSEKQRRYFLNIMAEAVEHILMNHEVIRFSASLWEFVLRIGFAFDEHRCPRAFDLSSDNTPQRASPSQSGISAALPPPMQATDSMVRASNRSELELELNLRKAVSEATPDIRRDTSQKFNFRQTALEEDVGAVLAFSSSSRIRMTDGEIASLTSEMLKPQIFGVGLSLEEFQQNLSTLNSISTGNLLKWLAHFEGRWKLELQERLQEELKNEDTLPRNYMESRLSMTSDTTPKSSPRSEDADSEGAVHRSPRADNRLEQDVPVHKESRAVSFQDSSAQDSRSCDEAREDFEHKASAESGIIAEVAQANWVRFTMHVVGAHRHKHAFKVFTSVVKKVSRVTQARTALLDDWMQKIESSRAELASALKDAMMREATSEKELKSAQRSLDEERYAFEQELQHLAELRSLLEHDKGEGLGFCPAFREAEEATRRNWKNLPRTGGNHPVADDLGLAVKREPLPSDRSCLSMPSSISSELPELTRKGFTGEGATKKPRATRSCETMCAGR